MTKSGIVLSTRDWDILLEMLHNPEEPTGLLKEAYDFYMLQHTTADDYEEKHNE